MKGWFVAVSLVLLFAGCGSSDMTYSPDKQAELTRRAVAVVNAAYVKIVKIKSQNELDIIEKRPSYSDQVQAGVVFKTKEVIKGNFQFPTFTVGVNMPSMAFKIKPGEYSGQKKYTLYIGFDKSYKKFTLIGAEWKEITY